MCEVLDYIGQHLLGPVLAALIGGPLAAATYKFLGVRKEVAENDAKAAELDEDLHRWVRDRNRDLERDIRTIVNSAGNQLYAGTIVNQTHAAMSLALQQYRDEATAKVRAFSALARSEGRWHKRHRQRYHFDPPVLGLPGHQRVELDRWRQRPHPVSPGSDEPDVVADDSTAQESSIAPLDTDEGLTWARAARRLPA